MLLTVTWYRQNMEFCMKIITDITPQNLLYLVNINPLALELDI